AELALEVSGGVDGLLVAGLPVAVLAAHGLPVFAVLALADGGGGVVHGFDDIAVLLVGIGLHRLAAYRARKAVGAGGRDQVGAELLAELLAVVELDLDILAHQVVKAVEVAVTRRADHDSA